MSRNKRIIIGIIVVALFMGLIFAGKYALDMRYYKEAMSTLTIGEIDLSHMNDGTYVGSYDARIISATVSVTVMNGRITDIKLMEHKYDRGRPAKAVLDKILKEQSLDVDVVSGSTNSSETILKAVENALNSGKRNN